ncbi:MBL fold metallo-hydrolase [Planctomicrobium piriforme]|uniref:Glyoxylase, beta-lactamase superfamily II n=1 Tax=Planctomicrobium piriforme TaxID=1576369 RepID=A0A1I3FBE1_9PLAN|nr:MBL fold metallo-hydrolase [Planctomicrobium piriforme]SFI08548.1 Glyoxylase, beta-lactamase superfamily II [Planctomicrobium piriforme]
MTSIHHINCGTLLVPGYPTVVCHCLLLEENGELALIDSGIGLLDVRNPVERLGQQLIDLAGFQFNEADTAVRRIESLGFSPSQVRHIVLTHCDPDHAGGLADFPDAQVHVAQEEFDHLARGHWRYVPRQFEHHPRWQKYRSSPHIWFGLQARPVALGFSTEVLLIPLFGHTLGHCGVAVQQGDRWLLHVGDAYYLRAELTDDNHPVASLAAQRADDDQLRRASLAELRRLFHEHGDQIDMFGYHDISELAGRQGP